MIEEQVNITFPPRPHPFAASFDFPAPVPGVLPFRIDVSEAALDDLAARLATTRMPDRETVADATQGVQLERLSALLQRWRSRYDWRRIEATVNAYPQFVTTIEGMNIQFLHVRSKHENALPILLTHGWPSCPLEFLNVIGPLVDPVAYGGRADEAFHVVLPALPGFGFAGGAACADGVPGIARAWATLMGRLGYARWVAQGGGWGASVTAALARLRDTGLAAVHFNAPDIAPPALHADLDEDEQAAVTRYATVHAVHGGPHKLQATRPQTLAYALSDSPIAQAAWIYDRLQAWMSGEHRPEAVLGVDRMLDTFTWYWLTGAGTNAARLNGLMTDCESMEAIPEMPVAVSIFAQETYRPPRAWAEAIYPRLYYWNTVPAGSHLPAQEQPAQFVSEMRRAFAPIR